MTLTGVLGLEGSPNSRARVSDGGGELSSCAAANLAAFLAAARGGILYRPPGPAPVALRGVEESTVVSEISVIDRTTEVLEQDVCAE